MTYAQNGEDDILARFFAGQPSGFFVDVGAYDGCTYSNTLLFEERGWRGICVEPHPAIFPLCQQARQYSICVQAACVADAQQMTAVLHLSQMNILATLNPDSWDRIALIHQNVGLHFNGFTKTTVPARTLDSILHECEPPKIDLLSIDTEWTNADVLRGLTLSYWCPRVVIVENDCHVRENMDSYHLVFEHGDNLFYVRDEDDIARMEAASDDR